jgi:DNA-binding NtrC family response regulator
MTELNGLRLLIAEDEFLIAIDLRAEVIALGGVVVSVAGTIAQALAAASDGTINAALLDINLNGEASFPVAHALQARHLPFAFVTGHGSAVLPESFGMAPILRKPFSRDELAKVLRRLAAGA